MNTSKKFVALIIRHPIRFLIRVLKGFKANQGVLLSGAVAYYTLLSIIPLFTLFLIGLSHLVDEQQLQGIITSNLEMIVPGYSQPILNEIENFLEHREVVGTIVVLFLIFFSSLAFTILENAMSVIFFHRVQIHRRHFMVSAVLPYLYILLLGIGLLMVTVISGALRAVKDPKIRLLAWTLGVDDFAGTILYLLGIAGMIVVLTSIYMVMPMGKIRLRHALVGGITGAILWEITRHILIWYFSTISLVNIIYGSLTTLIVALLSLEAGAMILLLGAQVIAEYERFDLEGEKEMQGLQGMETSQKKRSLLSLKKKTEAMKIQLKRVYEAAAVGDGFRILVDRIWPRGISKEKAKLDLWLKEIAPSNELRKWFDHDPERWKQFKEKYQTELENSTEAMQKIREAVKSHKKVTLVYSAKNREQNQAVVLKEFLEKKLP